MAQQYQKRLLTTFQAIIFLILVLLTGSFLKAQVYKPYWQLAGEGQKRYGVESAKIHYQYSGRSSGTEVLTFDNWGWRASRLVDKSTTMWGNTTKIRSTELQDGNYSISHMTGSSRARAFQDSQIQKSLIGSSMAVEVLHGLEVVKAKGAKKIGTDDVLGRKCDVYEIKNFSQKLWVWEGIVLRTEQKVLEDEIILSAVKIEADVEFGEQNFALPDGVEISGMPTSAGND